MIKIYTKMQKNKHFVQKKKQLEEMLEEEGKSVAVAADVVR